MKRIVFFALIIVITPLLLSCGSTKYIYDSSSIQRQKKLKTERSSMFLGEIFIATTSIVSSAILEIESDYTPTPQRFKRLSFSNPTSDTLYVNMLTDCTFDENTYCDYMDIRIPPGKNCRILCPINAEYNIYYSNTPQNDDDEMITINTSNTWAIKLIPGIKITSEAK